MAYRASPILWPVLAAASPVAAPFLVARYRRYRENVARAEARNRERLEALRPIDLPESERLELTVLVEAKAREGFRGDPGVSYLLRTEQGTLLFDVGFGPATPTFGHNLERAGIRLEEVDALAVSHLHADHMGGLAAFRAKRVAVPGVLRELHRPCFLPAEAEADGLAATVVTGPRMLPAGIATTGPLARSLFFLGLVEEQAVVANVKGKGLVVVTGCGHPTAGLILEAARRMSPLPVHALVGGLHFPITGGRVRQAGIDMQTVLGTGKPPWQRVTDRDLDETIGVLRASHPTRLLLSAHDTCDHALERLGREVGADTAVLEAGAVYTV